MSLSDLLLAAEPVLLRHWRSAADEQRLRLDRLLGEDAVFEQVKGLLSALFGVIEQSASADQVSRAVDRALPRILEHLHKLQETSALNATEIVVLLYNAKQAVGAWVREASASEAASPESSLDLAALDQLLLLLNRLGIVFLDSAMHSREGTVMEQDVLAVEYAMLYERTRQIAITDSLTGLYNYGYFLDRLRAERARAERYQRLLSLLVIDIDHFKHYNDHNGHLAGNEVLKRLGRILEDEAREVDFVARYGGEEFVVLVPEANRRSAFALAERIRDRVAETLFPHRETQPHGWLTISAGVATYPIDSSDEEELFRVADQSLYRAKARGRNRVVAHVPSDKVVLKFFPPRPASAVALVGNFNNWDLLADPMTEESDGSFRFEVALNPGTYRFKYVLDGSDWVSDPAHETEPDNYGGQNNVLRVRRAQG